MTDHSICTIRADSNHLISLLRTHDIKNTNNKSKHVLTSVLLKHWNRNEMKVVEFAFDVDSNVVIEVGFAIMS